MPTTAHPAPYGPCLPRPPIIRPPSARPAIRHMAKKLYIETHGCQMNEYDSSRMADLLGEHQALELTDNPREADVLLLNPCSIREKAQRSEEHTSELQSRENHVCRLLLETKKTSS